MLAAAAVLALLLGAVTGLVAHQRGESFGWWLLCGTVWAGIALPVLWWVRDGRWRRSDGVFIAAVVAGNAVVIVGGWELAGL